MNRSLDPPPVGSSFFFETTAEGWNRVSWNSSVPWYLRLAPAAFIAFWLMGWLAGEIAAIGMLIGLFAAAGPFAGVQGGGAGNWFVALFMIGWLGAWTAGGVAAIIALHKLLKRPRNESITLADDSLIYDPGTMSLANVKESNHSAFKTWKGEKPRTFKREEIDNICCERIGEVQRLSFDSGSNRIIVGATLREPEREWLAQVLHTWAGPTEPNN